MSVVGSVSPAKLGLGCVTFGREIDRTASFAMLDHAVQLGWRHVDTAVAYGAGASERIVGEWLAASGLRAEMTVGTKVLPPYSAAGLQTGVEQSAQRLGVETIDVLYLHRWDPTALDSAVLATLAALVRSGRVRLVGLSNFDANQLEQILSRVAECHGIGALQNVNNLALRAIDERTRQLCAAHRIEIITFSPLGAGFLTGKYARGVPEGSRFATIPGHQPLYFTPTGFARLARLQALAERTGIEAADLALAWALHQPQVSTVLIGGRTPAQLDRAARALMLDLPEVFGELERD